MNPTKPSLETKLQDQSYENYAFFSDTVATFGLGVATYYETSLLQYLLGFGTFCAALGVIAGRPNQNNHTVKLAQKTQPFLGTLAAVLSGGYYFLDNPRFATVLAGLATACYASSLSHLLRSKKKTDYPSQGLIGLLTQKEET